MIQPIQIPSLILPTVWVTGAETESVADALEHTSIEIDVSNLRDKIITVMAVEVVAVGAPGPLWAWVELSPYPSTVSTAFWAAIGGGGGALTPLVPTIIAGTGVNGTVHTFDLPWSVHAAYARLVVQTPAIAVGESWAVQAYLNGQAI